LLRRQVPRELLVPQGLRAPQVREQVQRVPLEPRVQPREQQEPQVQPRVP
jgi:hypothetical protein